MTHQSVAETVDADAIAQALKSTSFISAAKELEDLDEEQRRDLGSLLKLVRSHEVEDPHLVLTVLSTYHPEEEPPIPRREAHALSKARSLTRTWAWRDAQSEFLLMFALLKACSLASEAQVEPSLRSAALLATLDAAVATSPA